MDETQDRENLVYEILICKFCGLQAEWRKLDRLSWSWQCPNPVHGYKYLSADQVEKIRVRRIS